jgi:hypothetical protein
MFDSWIWVPRRGGRTFNRCGRAMPQVSRKHGARPRPAILVRMPKRNIRMVACVDQYVPACSRAGRLLINRITKINLCLAILWRGFEETGPSPSVKLRLVVIALILPCRRSGPLSTIPRSVEIGRGVKRKTPPLIKSGVSAFGYYHNGTPQG